MLLERNGWAPVTVEFVVTEELQICRIFLSPTNTTQQLHLLKFFIAGAQILFYESQTRNSYAHIFATVAAVNMNVKSWTKSAHPQISM